MPSGHGFIYLLDIIHLLLLAGVAWLGLKLSREGELFPAPLGALLIFCALYLAHAAWKRLAAPVPSQALSYIALHPLVFHPQWFWRQGELADLLRFLYGIWYWTWAAAAVQAWVFRKKID